MQRLPSRLEEGEMLKIYTGLSLNDWALPLHIFAGRPFTDENDRWVIQVVITFLCFYIAFEK